MAARTLRIAQDKAADELLANDPLALLTGMLLDQQFPMERAFAGPHLMAERLGVDRLDAAQLATYDPDKLTALMTGPPAVHRFPGSMGERVQAMCRILVDEYDGDAAKLWTGVTDGAELRKRLEALPGFGAQKAKIFVALLAKQYGVKPKGWEQAAGDYALDGFRSVADVTSAETLAKVRAHKQEMKAAAKASQAARA
ncbi:MAG: hypothetical protein QOK42_2045 [Frankiaceae bacterium]|jgi:uncharacterized HhH-GPD family protein|nr:hypothetical protein [Frankiaceae bacterium]